MSKMQKSHLLIQVTFLHLGALLFFEILQRVKHNLNHPSKTLIK